MKHLIIGLAISVFAGIGVGTCTYALGCIIPELVRDVVNWFKKPAKPANKKNGQ